jgi:AcrR family transcriptional regulator
VGRNYQKRQRAVAEAETRDRILEAAIALHQTLGPAGTSVADIAERAGVGRVTVYRHFPDPEVLARSCSGRYFQRHPVPNLKRWAAIAGADERVAFALTETYAYHRATEAMMTRVLAQARDHPVMEPYHAHWSAAAKLLLSPFRARGRSRNQLRAAIVLALSFETWRTLAHEGRLSDAEAVAIAAGVIRGGQAPRSSTPIAVTT